MADVDSTKKLGELVQARTLALQKTSSSLVQRGIKEIERLTTDSRVAVLIREMCESSNWNERENAWLELRKMGPTYRGWAESLRNAICSGDGWSRIFSAEALSRFSCNPEDVVPVLAATIEASLDAEDYDWGRVACGALGNFKALDSNLVKRVLPVLIRVLEETSQDNNSIPANKLNMRAYSILALGNYGNLAKLALVKLAPLLERRDDPLWQTYFEVSQRIDSRAKSQLDALTVALTSTDATTRGEAVLAIAKLGPEGLLAMPELLSFVNDESCDVRRFLAITLGKLGQTTPEIVHALNTLTDDPDDSVKVGTFYALACLGEKQQSNLRRVLRFLSHNDPFVRFLSVWAVGEIAAFDKDNALSCLAQAFSKEEHPRNKELMAQTLERIRKY